MLHDHLEWGGDEVGKGRDLQDGGDICTLKADSRCCMAEINTTW